MHARSWSSLADLARVLRLRRAPGAPRPPKPGVKTPGVQIPIERLKPDAVFGVPGTPDWLAIDEARLGVEQAEGQRVAASTRRRNTVAATIAVGKRPAPAWPPASAASGCPTAAIRR